MKSTRRSPVADKEWIIPHNEISDPKKITQRNIEEFKRHGENIHTLEVDKILKEAGQISAELIGQQAALCAAVPTCHLP